MGLTEALKLLGIATPFVYAVATYGFFHYLDKKASGAAKKAISVWLSQKRIAEVAVGDTLCEIFDRLYTRPLLGLRSFGRSTLFTVGMSAIFLYEFDLHGNRMYVGDLSSVFDLGWGWYAGLLTNIVSDYFSLFIIRSRLTMEMRRPIRSLVTGALIGILFVIVLFIIRELVLSFYTWVHLPPSVFDSFSDIFVDSIARNIKYYEWSALTIAALVVHGWLLLFAIGIMVLRVLNRILWATSKVQWFLQKGRDHPLDAIGYVAGALVLFSTAVAKVS
jgi:hypothetical protein